MKEVTVIVEKGNIGKDNTKIDPKGVQASVRPVRINLGFNDKQVVGTAELFIEDGMVKANMTLFKDEYDHMYPSVGYKIIEQKGDVITKAWILVIGLSENKNFDESIKSIGEQISNN